MPDQDFDLISDVVSRLEVLGTEATLDQVRSILADLEGKDFASNASLDAIAALLTSLNGKDYASDTRLEIVVQVLESIETALGQQQTNGLTNDELRELPVETADQSVLNALANRFGGGKEAAVARLSDTELTPIKTPDSGHSLNLYWVSAINKSPSTNMPTITIRLGDRVLYQVSAISHWELFEGAIDEAITAQLDQPGSVDLTIHYREIFP